MKKKKIAKKLFELQKHLGIIEKNNRKDINTLMSIIQDIKINSIVPQHKDIKKIVQNIQNEDINKFEELKKTQEVKDSKEITINNISKAKDSNLILFADIKSDLLDSIQPINSKRIFISFLGKTASTKDGFFDNRVEYFSNIEGLEFENKKSLNMTHLLARFAETSKYVQIATVEAKDFQMELGKYLSLPKHIFENLELIYNEIDYLEIFNIVNNIISREKALCSKDTEIIIDLTHGFRHMPILAILSIVTQRLTTKNLSHILFAKEIEREIKYEVIDLIDLIDITNIKFTFENFNSGYTILPVPEVKNLKLKALLTLLQQFSRIMTGNLFGELLKEGSDSILKKLLNSLDEVRQLEESQPFLNALEEIKKHISQISKIAKLNKPYEQLEAMAKIFFARKYYLNTILLLNEAVGHYYSELIKNLGIPEVNSAISESETDANFQYKLATSARGVIQGLLDPSAQSLFLSKKETTLKIRERLKRHISEENIEKLISFTEQVKNWRNLVSHGTLSTDNSLNVDIEGEISRLFLTFEEIVNSRGYIIQKPLTLIEPKKEKEIIYEREDFKILDLALNYTKATKYEIDGWRIPNLTELSEIYKSNAKNLPKQAWSSTEVQGDLTKNYVLKNNESKPFSKQAPTNLILVNQQFNKLSDFFGESENLRFIDSQKQIQTLQDKLSGFKSWSQKSENSSF